eukprot:COSAG01_NODE_9309_length_2488_cov_2.126831_1_plen_21_part_10
MMAGVGLSVRKGNKRTARQIA